MKMFSSKQAQSRQRLQKSFSTSLEYQSLEERALLATTTGFDAGVLTIQMNEVGDVATLDTNNSDVITVNGSIIRDGNGASLDAAEVSRIVVTGTGNGSQSVTLDGIFDYEALDSVLLADVSEISFLGDYELLGDFVVDSDSATGFFSQDEDSRLYVEGDVNVKFNSLVTLSALDNDFVGDVSVESLGVLIVDRNDLTLGDIRSEGSIAVNADGDITQRAGTSIQDPLLVAMTATGDIVLPNRANDFNEVNFSAANLTLGEANSLRLAELTVAGDVTINASGDVETQFQSEYLFEGDLRDAKRAGPDLEAIGGTLSNGRFSFGIGEGLKLSTGDVQTEYFVEFDFQFEASDLNYNRLLEFKNRTSDNGLYLRESKLVFYGATTAGTTSLTPGQIYTVGVQRSANGAVTVFLDGNVELAFDDSFSLATFENLHFFIDDTTRFSDEEAPGSVEAIRINQRRLVVGGDLNVIAGGDIDLAANNQAVVGSVSLRGHDVSYNHEGLLELDRLVARGDLSLYASGEIKQVGPALRVLGSANINSRGDVRLANLGNNFRGPVSVQGDSVALSDANNIQLENVKAEKTLKVIADGFITNTANANLSGNVGDFRAQNIQLGLADDDFVRFSLLNLDASSRAEVHQDGSVRIGSLSAGSLVLSSTGSIRDIVDAQISVTNNAKFVAAEVISLGDSESDSLNTGSVVLQAGTFVSFHENSDLEFIGNSFATFLSVSAEGRMFDKANAAIRVSGRVIFRAESLEIGESSMDQFKAGSLTLEVSGDAEVHEDSTLLLTGNSNVGGDLSLFSKDFILDSISSFATIEGHLHLEARGVVLGDRLTSFLSAKTVSFDEARGVTLFFDSPLVFAGSSEALNATLYSSVRIGNAAGADVSIASTAILQAPRVILGKATGDSIEAGRLTVEAAGRADMEFDGRVVFKGDSTADSLRLVSTHAILDTPTSQINVNKHARLIAPTINIGDKTSDQFNAGSLSFVSTGSVSIQEDSDMLLAGPSRSRTLKLTSTEDIRDTATARTTVTESAEFYGIDLIIGELEDDCFDLIAGMEGLTTQGSGSVNVKIGC